MSDIEEYIQQQQIILTELSTLESKDFETKEKYIIRLKEVTRPLVESGYYEGVKVNDLASFIQKNLLEKHNITYPDNGRYYSLFADDEKHTKGDDSTLSRKKISPLPIEQKTGNDVIDRLKFVERNGFEMPVSAFGKYLMLIKDTSLETEKQATSIIKKLGNAIAYVEDFDKLFPDKKELQREIDSLVGKKKKDLEERYEYYQKSSDMIFQIEDAINDVFKKSSELLKIKAEQKAITKMLDERNKITFIEKWNAILCTSVKLNLSAVAKKLGIDKKHMTNNILPTNNPITNTRNRHHDFINWFRAITIITPKGEKLTFDAKEYFDAQIEKNKLVGDYEMIDDTPMILKNCEISS